MCEVVARIFYTVLRKAGMPNLSVESEFFLCSERKSTFDELHAFLNRMFMRRRQYQMNVVAHDHIFMELKAGFLAIFTQNINEEQRHTIRLEDCGLSGGVGGKEERPDLLGGEPGHGRCYTPRAKAQFLFQAARGAKAPLFYPRAG